jgi:hypothetical protein
MSALPDAYLAALVLLGRASERYRRTTNRRVVIVGGAAVSFYTQGAILSGDFDIVADMDFEREMLAEGFIKEARAGMLLVGYYHPDVPQLGFQIVSGRLFDGFSDEDKLLLVPMASGSEVLFASVEDLIADRLGQYEASDRKAGDMLYQAELLFSLAGEYDRAYLLRRIGQDGGDPSMIGLE